MARKSIYCLAIDVVIGFLEWRRWKTVKKGRCSIGMSSTFEANLIRVEPYCALRLLISHHVFYFLIMIQGFFKAVLTLPSWDFGWCARGHPPTKPALSSASLRRIQPNAERRGCTKAAANTIWRKKLRRAKGNDKSE